MLAFFRRPAAPRPSFRARLHLETLEHRENPTGPPVPFAPITETAPPISINVRPVIEDFNVEPIANGTFFITGRVVDENVAGMIVTLGGSTSCAGQQITVNSDGTFTKIVQLATDGTDSGWITATTIDAEGWQSEEVDWEVVPY